MHYQAAERALLFLNSDLIQKIVKANLQRAFPLVVKGLINANRGANAHWNPTVNTVTMTVMRSYMELSRDMFERIQQNNQSEESKKQDFERKLFSNWEVLERKVGAKHQL
mmetsp:Transcript_12771/g.21578  ORF Transcript_12771/g.21578 Transcript_12771/m.21578 type:complete len:110 (+) Transcript_12771:1290-1619(+)